ncbi:MAG: glucokinase [Pseudomonadota bacterium]
MSGNEFALVGDIGGTNARFALVRAGETRLEAIQTLRCRDYENPGCAIIDYLQKVGVATVAEVCLAVASPDRGSRVRLTNNHWSFDREEMRKQFQWRTFRTINDFTAMALGVPHVAAGKLVHVCGGPGDSRGPRLVMGPGTGLGVSGLVPVAQGWVPLITEGGHVDFAPVDDTEMAVLHILGARFGRVSVERILCGQGLLNLYQAHAEIQGLTARLDDPEKITAAAIGDADPLAVQTLGHFCEILGRVAGNAALTLGSTGGVYLCGGILPRILTFFLNSPFQSGFENKGRMRPLMEFTPVYVVNEPCAGLLGAAQALANPEV